jgi:hypothetical protein
MVFDEADLFMFVEMGCVLILASFLEFALAQ